MSKLAPNTELTPKEAAQKLGVHVNTVYRWMGSGALSYRHVGFRYLILAQDLDKLADYHEAVKEAME